MKCLRKKTVVYCIKGNESHVEIFTQLSKKSYILTQSAQELDVSLQSYYEQLTDGENNIKQSI